MGLPKNNKNKKIPKGETAPKKEKATLDKNYDNRNKYDKIHCLKEGR